MLLNVSSIESKAKPKGKETKSYLLMLLLEKRPLKKSKRLKDRQEELRLLSSKNTTSKVRVIRKLTKNWSMNSYNKRPKDNIRCVRPNGTERNKPE